MSLQKYRADEWSGSSMLYDPREVDAEIARLQRAVEWCLEHHASRALNTATGERFIYTESGDPVPAEFADIICPTTGDGNG